MFLKRHNKCIIVAVEMETNGLFNFLLPLRAKTRSTDQMRPIILLFKKRYLTKFLTKIFYYCFIDHLKNILKQFHVFHLYFILKEK